MTIFNKLPEEIKDKILKMYWQHIFSEKVIKEIELIKYTIDRIDSYMIHHGKTSIINDLSNPIIVHHRHYYIKHNNYIKKLISNKVTQQLLCNIIGKDPIKFNLWLWSKYIENISSDYKYLTIYYIMNKDKIVINNNLEYNNDKIINYFSFFSKYKIHRSNSI